MPEGQFSPHLACIAGDLGSISGLGKSPGEGNGYTLQYSCPENPMDRGAWWATVRGSQRARQNWATFTFTVTSCLVSTTNLYPNEHLIVAPRHPPRSEGNLLPHGVPCCRKRQFYPSSCSVSLDSPLPLNSTYKWSANPVRSIFKICPKLTTMTPTSIPASIVCPLGCYSSFPATWAPVVCPRHVSQRELLIKEIRICHFPTSHIQGLSFDLMVKAEVTTVASK